MTEPATPLPALKPCPFCGGDATLEAGLDYVGNEEEFDAWWAMCRACNVYASHDTETECAEAWNRRPRLADGLRPETPAPPDTAETLAWLCRALTTLALRHGVTLPPFPRRPT